MVVGRAKEYAAFRGKQKDEFSTDSLLIADFKKTVEHLVNRINTYTGVPFKNDKAILGWETGNELEPTTYKWTRTIASYIKSLDKNHLVLEGTHGNSVSGEALADTNIDVVSAHYYVPAYRMISSMLRARAKARGKKPFFIGEFGFMPLDSIRSVLDSVIANGISGIMIWDMRQHARRWVLLPGTSLRWPGFASGSRNDEINVIGLLSRKRTNERPHATFIARPRGDRSAGSVPLSVSWRGSTGAVSYK